MRKEVKKKATFKRLPLAAALLGCLYGPLALAQDQAAQEEGQAEEKKEAATLDRITVTGSLLKRLQYDSASPVQVITADTSAALGQIDVADMLQSSSVASGSTQISHQFSGFVIDGGLGVQTVSLRGIGAQRTLVLLDGRRPGPAGVRGSVGAFDLNVIPSSILQRAEILKDGSSSIYGSDAVAGVINLITRRSVDEPTISVQANMPFESGGESYSISAANGWGFDNGSVVVAAEWFRHEALKRGDRDFLRCSEDLVWGPDGERVDRADGSILAGTELAGCNNLYANTVFDLITGRRYIPSPDGVTIGLMPGYRPRANTTYLSSDNPYYEDVLNFDFMDEQDAINEQDRKSLYVASDFTFGDVNWYGKAIYNNRSTKATGFRQFFPFIAPFYADNPDYEVPVPSGFALPVMPFPFDQEVEIDYYYLNTGLEGTLPFGEYWSWSADLSHSKSKGTYRGLNIIASRTGDLDYTDQAPLVDYFDPGILSGERMAELVDAIGEWTEGDTTYKQTMFSGAITGGLFELPAGSVDMALGIEHRRFSIDDQPSDQELNGDLWGISTAQVTKGKDDVTEIFAEFEIPLVSGKPGFELFSLNVSGRAFDYKSVEDSDSVWKAGLNWQISPALKLRATRGTSYRAPGLYELYIGNQTGFLAQAIIDPCVEWGESTNENLRANCAASGIPDDYIGAASSATIVTGGGAGVLKPETSRAFTTGIVLTPTSANISIALDYFDFEINDQVDQLGAGAILGGCYAAPVFPNSFCDLFDRNPADHPTAPLAITEVRDSFVNVNKQTVRGYDLLFRYEGEFAIGKLEVEGQTTYTTEAIELLFDSEQEDGFNTDDRRGSIGNPKTVSNLRTALKRGDWTYTWFIDYVDDTRSLTANAVFNYLGLPNATRDIKAESRVYNGASVRYAQDKWDVLFGISNLFDEEPPTISAGIGNSRYGNVPAFATQYDWYGRSAYMRFNYRF